MKSIKITAVTLAGEIALSRVLPKRDIENLIPLALKKAGAKKDIDYIIEVEL